VKPAEKILIVAALIMYTFTAYVLGYATSMNQVVRTPATSVVYEVCQYTRTTNAHEDACAIAQDVSHTEYLCTQRNTSKTNTCWVEVK
jgi:hypothetical protein